MNHKLNKVSPTISLVYMFILSVSATLLMRIDDTIHISKTTFGEQNKQRMPLDRMFCVIKNTENKKGIQLESCVLRIIVDNEPTCVFIGFCRDPSLKRQPMKKDIELFNLSKVKSATTLTYNASLTIYDTVINPETNKYPCGSRRLETPEQPISQVARDFLIYEWDGMASSLADVNIILNNDDSYYKSCRNFKIGVSWRVVK